MVKTRNIGIALSALAFGAACGSEPPFRQPAPPARAGETPVDPLEDHAGGSMSAAAAIHGNPAARLPPMGYNTYYAQRHGKNPGPAGYGCYLTSAQLELIAHDMVQYGLAAAGYTLLDVDAGWWYAYGDALPYARTRVLDAAGHETPTIRLNQGWEDIAGAVTRIKGLGLSLGIYTDTGAGDAAGCGGMPGSGKYIAEDIAQLDAWGFDYVKVDHCGGNPHAGSDGPYAGSNTEYALWSSAILDHAARGGRQLMLNAYVYDRDHFTGWASAMANIWRTGKDLEVIDCFSDADDPVRWPTILRNFDANDVPMAAGPGHWNSPDYLLIGPDYPGLTRPGADALRDLLLNPEAIAIDQDPLGAQGEKVREDYPGVVVYVKRLAASGQRAVLLLNRTGYAHDASVSLDDMDLARVTTHVRDVASRADMAPVDAGVTVTLGPYQSRLLRFASADKSVSANTGMEALGGKLSGTADGVWTADGTFVVVGTGPDRLPWMRTWAGSWSEWSLVPFAFSDAGYFEIRGEPSLSSRGNEVHLVASGYRSKNAQVSEHQVLHAYSLDGGRTWSGIEDLGKVDFSAYPDYDQSGVFGRVAGIWRDSGHFDVVARAANGALYAKSYGPYGWSAWSYLGGCATTGVDLTSSNDGVVWMATAGCDGRVWLGRYAADAAVDVQWVLPSTTAYTSSAPALAYDAASASLIVSYRTHASDIASIRWRDGSATPLGTVASCAKGALASASRPAYLGGVDVLIAGCNAYDKVSWDDANADAVFRAVVR